MLRNIADDLLRLAFTGLILAAVWTALHAANPDQPRERPAATEKFTNSAQVGAYMPESGR